MGTNEERLRLTLATLGSLRAELVLLGGASTQLLITDPAAAGERPTDDVDFIVDCDARGCTRSRRDFAISTDLSTAT